MTSILKSKLLRFQKPARRGGLPHPVTKSSAFRNLPKILGIFDRGRSACGKHIKSFEDAGHASPEAGRNLMDQPADQQAAEQEQPQLSLPKSSGERVITIFIVLTILVAVGALYYTGKTIFVGNTVENTITSGAVTEAGEDSNSQSNSHTKSLSLTGYDRALAKQFMDKDNDGKCDSCGMPVEMCMDTGQLQCDMDPKSTLGVLDSAHLHADWKIYINGNAVDLSDKAHMERMRAGLPVSSFIHVDSGAPAPEQTGEVLHMHATGVPLWIFFESVGMKFDKDCLTLEDGKKYCNDAQNSLKFYVNNQLHADYEQYVFKDLDNILISYGAKKENVQPQLAAITNFAGIH
ncbi:MAG: hypothetical protein AABX13_05300 [Nanoarchaeota archaeon]